MRSLLTERPARDDGAAAGWSRASWLRDAVEDRLAMGWSPEIIAARLAHGHSSKVISHESIYRYIYSPQGRRHKLHRYLRPRKGRRGHRARKYTASRIPYRVPVHDRPQEAKSVPHSATGKASI